MAALVGLALTSCTPSGVVAGSSDASAPPCVAGSERPRSHAVVEVVFDGVTLSVVPASVPPADGVVLVVDNRGPVDHELLVVKGSILDDAERDPFDGSLLHDFGTVPGERRLVARLDAVPAGTSCELHLVLPPGEHSLLSDLVVDGVAYSAEGALAPLTVEGVEQDEGDGPPIAPGRP